MKYERIQGLPEKWCIERTPETCADVNRIFSRIYKKLYTHNGVSERSSSNYLHYPPKEGKTRVVFTYPLKDYTIITVEEYKNMMEKNKKLIGYKLKFAEYNKAALAICDTRSWESNNINFKPGSLAESALRDAEVLDKWFEEVYESIPELPSVKGYQGEIQGECIKYGCAYVPIAWFTVSATTKINSMNVGNNVYLTPQNVQEIREYLKYHGHVK